jgi:NADH-quinone oxidoreductase subunit N
MPLLPQVIVAAAAVLLMIAIAIRRSYGAVVTIALAGLAGGLALLWLVPGAAAVTPLFQVDAYARFFTALLLGTSLLVALLSVDYVRACSERAEEYYILLLLATLGATLLVAASHCASFFLGVELLSVSLYALIAFVRRREAAIEAGVKYLILAGFSSAFLLFGMALVYAQTGSLRFAEIALLLAAPQRALGDPIALVGFALILVGVGFKLGIVPFHMWTPDIYQAAPAPVTAWIATASKAAVIALLVRFVGQIGLQQQTAFGFLLALLAGASMFVGNLLALRQASLKRLLAYSSIAHLGYLLVAFLAGGQHGIAAVSFYLVAYTITTLLAFGVIALLSSHRGAAGDRDALRAYRGLGRRHPWLSALLVAALLSLAGIPLTAGFVGKFLVLAAGVRAAVWTLVVLLVINSALSIYYYLRVIVEVTLRRDGDRPVGAAGLSLPAGIALALLAILLIALGIAPGALLDALATLRPSV